VSAPKHKRWIELKTAFELAFSPGSDRVAAIGKRDVTALELKTGAVIFSVHPIANPSHIDWSPDGETLVVKGTSGRTIILDAGTGDLLQDFRNAKEGEGDRALFAADGAYIVSVSWGGLFSVRERKTAKLVYEQQYEEAQLTSLCTTGSRRDFFYTVSRAPRANEDWNPSAIAEQRWPRPRAKARELPKGWIGMEQLQPSPSGRFLAVVAGGVPKQLEVYDRKARQTLATAKWDGSPGCALAWSADETMLITNGEDCFYTYGVPKLSQPLKVPLPFACFAAMSPNDRFVGLGSWKKSYVVETSALKEFATATQR
jgi:hypothetical protein